MKKTTIKRLSFALAMFGFCHAAAWAQVNIKGATVDASQGYTLGGIAPTGHALCGNGTRYVDSASCGAAAFYQFVQANGSTLGQQTTLNFDSNFAPANGGSATIVHLASNISVNAASATNASNANAVGGVGLSGLCQTSGAGCASAPIVKTLVITSGICSTAAGSGSSCTFGATWGSAFVDSSYAVSCTGNGMSGHVTQLWTSTKGTGTFTISLINGTADGAVISTFAEIDCIGAR